MNLLKPSLLDRNRTRDLKGFQRRIGYRFRRVLLLHEAMTHTSYASQQLGAPLPDNERLEFLGDAVLGLIIADYLYRQYPTLQEGQLTKLRSQMVSRTALVEYAQALALDDLILWSDGRTGRNTHLSSSTIAGATEALIGAIYLDGGLKSAQKFLFRNLRHLIDRFEAGLGEQDYKSLLQELALRTMKLTPRYRVVQETGPEHEKWFQVQGMIGGVVYGQGWGRSKKAAEQMCAAAALQQLSGAAEGKEDRWKPHLKRSVA